MKHADQLKGQFSYNKTQVLFLTKMTVEQYGNFQVDTALAWVEHYYHAMNADALISTTSFMEWWKYQWNLVDDEYILNDLYVLLDNSGCFVLYRQLHQYVFDNKDTHQQRLVADFNAMRTNFEKEMKAKEVAHHEA